MSVFDLPRLHFAGTATTQLPTGLRTGLLDLADNTVLTPEGHRFPHHRPAAEYHRELDRLDLRTAPGAHFAASGHFTVDAAVTAVEPAPERPEPLLGRSVDFWGHYNEYFATTANRARVFDVDPSSSWTTTLMIGQLCFGRLGRSHDVGYLCTGEVTGYQPPHWQVFPPGPSPVPRLPVRSVHQFAVPAAGLGWPSAEPSPTVARLRELVDGGAAAGLVVQFALNAQPGPLPTGRPVSWRLDGTIAPWYPGEAAGHPAGRLLTAVAPAPGPRQLTAEIGERTVGLNLLAAPAPEPGRAGHWELRADRTGRLLATLADPLPRTVLTLPRHSGRDQVEEPLRLDRIEPDGGRRVALRERETNVQADPAALVLDHPRHPGDGEWDAEVTVRALVRGRPAAVRGIRVRQYPNPRARPLDPPAEVARLRADGADWSGECTLDTGPDGLGRFTVRGARPGCARLLLAPPDAELPEDIPDPGGATGAAGAARAYDDQDALGYWSGAGRLALRVLPDDWRLDDLPAEQLTFDLLHREVFAFYELTSGFMKEEVFSLADRARVDTYARLIWQMCDPRNKSRTYYMPPTRDLSEPKSRLLLRYLRALQTPPALLTLAPARPSAPAALGTRSQLVAALWEAVTVELAVTLQYLYAAYSLPTHGAGLGYLRPGGWTAERLRLVSGDGGETLEHGIRSTLLRVAREEMTHFLVVNNVLTAIGERFRFPAIDFATLNQRLRIPLDLSLEGLTAGSVQRFITLEQPDRSLPDPRYGDRAALAPTASDTLSGLYAAIRDGLVRQPELFDRAGRRAGGEHHVFLRRSVNSVHPDYQLQVDDLSSALFAIDFVTEQGEGGAVDEPGEGGEESHHQAFRRVAELLDRLGAGPGPGLPELGYPVLRNPTRYSPGGNQQQITDPTARGIARLCDEAYALMAQLMVQHFGEPASPSLRRSVLMNAAIDVMNGVLRPLAELLVTLPSGVPGRTAGPPFALTRAPVPVPDPARARELLRRRVGRLHRAVWGCPLVPEQVGGVLAHLDGVLRVTADGRTT
ncbi:ferritin-like domain-containing protein [Kitasatospora viridis]|uniref:Ferritin-like protein n=1 Tax=Kitasatospora viridis TaxID=281105 RepID=A0A561SEY7_9ACTN|nr:ferritin-like domain-containing protein [Kitasatospora viridis]TWF73402.1 ferritin-like protein [Kitasatospora viridis]